MGITGLKIGSDGIVQLLERLMVLLCMIYPVLFQSHPRRLIRLNAVYRKCTLMWM